jgi:hypothetical protein
MLRSKKFNNNYKRKIVRVRESERRNNTALVWFLTDSPFLGFRLDALWSGQAGWGEELVVYIQESLKDY